MILGLALAALALPWGIYPALGVLRQRRRSPVDGGEEGIRKTVAVVIATRDKPDQVADKVANLLDPAQTARVVSVVVGVDHNGQWSPDEYRRGLRDPRVTVVAGPRPGGKAVTLNAAVEASPDCDFVLIADTAQRFEPGAVGALVRSCVAEGWAGASGVVRPLRQGIPGRIWQRFELGIRAGQSAARGLVTTSGAITMLRRPAWTPLPAGTICDDLYLSMSVALGGDKIGLCTSAVAVDPRRVGPREAFEKKVRTLTGLWQYILVLEPTALDPFRNPLWFDFFTHKIMRLLTPPLALVVVISALAWLAGATDGAILPWLPLALAPLVGLALVETTRWRLVTVLAPALATWNGLRKDWDVWHTGKESRER